MEALIAANYTLATWDQECAANKARVIAHYLEKAHREGFESEKAEEKAAKKGNDSSPSNPDSPASPHFQHRQAILQQRLARKMQRDGKGAKK